MLSVRELHVERLVQTELVRFNGEWYEIKPAQYEPEYQTRTIAWDLIKNSGSSKQAYLKYFENLRNDSAILEQSHK